MARLFVLTAAAAILGLAVGTERTVVVTGATGRTGSKTYMLLKEAGINVRGVVRNITKARSLLGCSKCDESEGIFVGDVTKQESLGAAMVDADVLVITVGRPHGTSMDVAKDILFDGVANQVAAFLSSKGPQPQDRHVALISMGKTTLPDTLMNKLMAYMWGGWDVGFYSLQGEAHLMSAGVPFTILKPCALSEDPAKQKEIRTGHDDKGMPWQAFQLSRGDVARVLAAAAVNPKMAKGLRFEICGLQVGGAPQDDAIDILKDGMQPWDPRKTLSAMTLV